MKSLLHSKYFKKRLKKWLIMYIAVMAFFTTAVTYSRYVSILFGNDDGDSARVSMFELDLMYCEDSSCSTGTKDSFQTTKIRPFGTITYYFQADASRIEVNADVTYTFIVNDYFKIKEVNKVGGSALQKSGTTSYQDYFSATDTSAVYEVVVEFDSSGMSCSGSSKNCVVTNDSDNFGAPKYIFENNAIYDVIKVGYLVEQKA